MKHVAYAIVFTAAVLFGGTIVASCTVDSAPKIFAAKVCALFTDKWRALHRVGVLGSMLPDASNATATRILGLSHTVRAGTSIQTGLTAAAATGGAVYVQAGTYNITTPLRIS